MDIKDFDPRSWDWSSKGIASPIAAIALGALGLGYNYYNGKKVSKEFMDNLSEYKKNKKNKLSNSALNNLRVFSGTGTVAQQASPTLKKNMFGDQDNSFYISEEYARQLQPYLGKKDKLPVNVDKAGAIYYSKNQKVPAIIAHEYGHAKSHQAGTAPNPVVTALIGGGSGLLGFVGGKAAMIASREGSLPKGYELPIIVASGLLPAVIGGTWAANRVVSEEENATRNALKFLKKLKRNKQQLTEDEQLLDKALDTYRTGRNSAMLTPLAMSALGTGGLLLLRNILNRK